MKWKSDVHEGSAGTLARCFEMAAKPRREEADRSVRAPLDWLGLLVILLQRPNLHLAALQ